MLSTGAVRSAAGSAQYFARDDYYTAEHSSEATAWGGKGAELLGLSGPVDKDTFEKLLNGIQPDGTAVGQVPNRRLAEDMVFSMPKSLSVMAYVAGDERLLAANMKAVQKTMAWVEKTYAEGRTYERSKSGDPVRTGNLVYALFQHDTSRSLDPQGHIHAVVANMTRMPDGNWRALRNDNLHEFNTTIGATYHAYLRDEAQKLGYGIEMTGKYGTFELAGVPTEVIKDFSQRRTDILDRAQELGITEPAGLEEVALRTRDPKLNADDRDALRELWRERAAELGFDGKALVEQAKGRTAVNLGKDRGSDDFPRPIAALRTVIKEVGTALGSLFEKSDPLVDRSLKTVLSPNELRTQTAVASAIRVLEQREAAFSLEALTQRALNFGLKGVTVDRIDARVSELLKSDRLIPGMSGRVDQALTHVTTPESLASEIKIQQELEKGRGASAPVLAPEIAAERLQNAAGSVPMKDEQLDAGKLALASEDRIVVVQGVSGSGKSTVMAAIGRVAEAEGRKVVGIAPTNKLVTDLTHETDREWGTISAFVNKYARSALRGQGERYEADKESLKDAVIMVDEGSMTGNITMKHLLGIANAFGAAKLIVIGDRQQIQPVDQGKAFSLLQASGAAMAHMTENMRQKTDQLRKVAALTNKGHAREALETLGDKVIESENHLEDAAKAWLGLSPEERGKTTIITSGKVARAEVNELIQDGLVADGTLRGEAVTQTVLEKVNITREELRYATSYKSGQVLDVRRPMNYAGLGNGRYDVLGVDKKGRVELRTPGGRVIAFDPKRIDPKDKRDAMELSDKQDIALREGERIRWTTNDKKRGILNADLASVLSVSKDAVTVRTSKGETVELRHGDPMLERMGLAYAVNVYVAQGMTVEKAITTMSSWESNLSNQRQLNVVATRVQYDLQVYTNDKERLITAIEKNPGNKESSLEATGRIVIDPPTGRGGYATQAAPSASAGQMQARSTTVSFEQHKPASTTPAAQPTAERSTGMKDGRLHLDTMAPPGVQPDPEKSRIPERYQDIGR